MTKYSGEQSEADCISRLSSVVERRFCKARVLGSNPRGGSKYIYHTEPVLRERL